MILKRAIYWFGRGLGSTIRSSRILYSNAEGNIMTEMVLDVQTLTPFSEEKPRFDHLIGMFSDGRISIDDFLAEKQRERELERGKKNK